MWAIWLAAGIAMLASGVASDAHENLEGLPTGSTNVKKLVYDVCDMKDEGRERKWSEVRNIYIRGENANPLTFYEYATKQMPQSVTYRLFRNYYNSDTFLDDHMKHYLCSRHNRVRKLLQSEEPSERAVSDRYCDGYSGETSGFDHASMTQAIPKAVQNWIPIFMSTVEFEKAVDQIASGGSKGAAHEALKEAFYFYFGEEGTYDKDCAPVITTDKRRDNFGPSNQEAILSVFREANAELQKESPRASELRRLFHRVTALHLVVYAKATTRYGFFLDEAEPGLPAYKYRTEGKTFYKVITPYVALVDPEGAARVESIYEDDNAPVLADGNYYCQVDEVMRCFVRSMGSYGITVEENYGTLENTEGSSCPTPSCHSNSLRFDDDGGSQFGNHHNAGRPPFASLAIAAAGALSCLII